MDKNSITKHEMKERRMKKGGIYQIIVHLSVKFAVVNVMIHKTVYMYANSES